MVGACTVEIDGIVFAWRESESSVESEHFKSLRVLQTSVSKPDRRMDHLKPLNPKLIVFRFTVQHLSNALHSIETDFPFTKQ